MERILTAAQKKPLMLKSLPFFVMHLMPLGMLVTGARPRDFALCAFLYFSRMFFITGAYHRYFSHRTYKMGRVMQFLMAWGGGTAAQRGALWWAAHHRDHHKYSDQPKDVHSPKDGLFWAHVGWIISPMADGTKYDRIKDLSKYPELVWLNKYHLVPPIVLGVTVYALGGASALFCGFFLSTVLLYHGTFTINSLSHVWGTRRYSTKDTSRNSLILALVTLGEGWHNNHHYYSASTSQGFYWWEIDISYYILKALSWVGLTQEVKRPPAKVRERNKVVDVGDEGLGIAPPAAAE